MLGFTRSTLRVQHQPTHLQDTADDAIPAKAGATTKRMTGSKFDSVACALGTVEVPMLGFTRSSLRVQHQPTSMS